MLMDLLLSSGIVMTAVSRSFPLFHERVQIVLRGHRDPDNLGYAFLEHVDEVNVSRYAFRLHISNDAHVKIRKGKSDSLAGQVADSALPGNMDPLGSWEGSLTTDPARTISDGGYHQSVDANRDTLFIPGPADRYSGEVEIRVSLSRTYHPSRLANVAGFTLPARGASWVRELAAWLESTGGQPRRLPVRALRLYERVLIPRDLFLRAELPDPVTGPGQPAAIEEVDPTAALPGHLIQVSPGEILRRDVFVLGFDPEKLQILGDEVLARLEGSLLPISGQHSAAVSRLAEHGTVSRHALQYMLSYQMFTSMLALMLSDGGLVMPGLVQPGGPVTDDYGTVTVSVRLTSPHVAGYFSGWLESVGYHFTEFNDNLSQQYTWSVGTGGKLTGITGDLGQTSPVSPQKQQATGGLDGAVSGSATRFAYSVLQTMPRSVARNRRIPWLRVLFDAVVTITVNVRSQRDLIDLPGGEVTVSFLVRKALELGAGPEASVRFGLFPRGAIPIPSGLFFPHGHDTRAIILAAFSLLPYTRDPNATLLSPEPDSRDWYTLAGRYDHDQDTFHIGYAYPPRTAFPVGFAQRGVFAGGADLSALEFAAHLWGIFQADNLRVRHQPPARMPYLVFASSHAGLTGPGGRPPFAQRVATLLRTLALASPAEVYQDAQGETLSGYVRPDPTGRLVVSGTPWILFDEHGPLVNQPASESLRTVITEELPADGPYPMRSEAVASVNLPPATLTAFGRRTPGSPAAGDVTIVGGLIASYPFAGRTDTIVLRDAGSEPGLDGLSERDRSGLRTLTYRQDRVNVYVTERAARSLPRQDMLTALEELARALPPGPAHIVLYYDYAGSTHSEGRGPLGHQLAIVTNRTVYAPTGPLALAELAATPRPRLYVDDPGNLASSWMAFSPTGEHPVAAGALLEDVSWQLSLAESLERLEAIPGLELRRVPSGLAVFSRRIDDPEQDGRLGLARMQPLRADMPTLVIDPEIGGLIDLLLDRLSAIDIDPVHLIYLPPVMLGGLLESPDRPVSASSAWQVEAVPSGLWLHTRDAGPDTGASVRAAVPGPRYQITIDGADSSLRRDLAREFINRLPSRVRERLALDFRGVARGAEQIAVSQIAGGMPENAISTLPPAITGGRRLESFAFFGPRQVPELAPGGLFQAPQPLIGRVMTGDDVDARPERLGRPVDCRAAARRPDPGAGRATDAAGTDRWHDHAGRHPVQGGQGRSILRSRRRAFHLRHLGGVARGRRRR